MFLEIGEYALITIAFISNIWQNYARLALSESEYYLDKFQFFL